MQEVFEKIIEKLEEQKSDLTSWAEDEAYKLAIERSIEIVKQESEQYNGGWISCSERLPEKEGSYLVVGKTGGAVVTRWYAPSEYYPNGHFGGNCADYIRYWMPRPIAPE